MYVYVCIYMYIYIYIYILFAGHPAERAHQRVRAGRRVGPGAHDTSSDNK